MRTLIRSSLGLLLLASAAFATSVMAADGGVDSGADAASDGGAAGSSGSDAGVPTQDKCDFSVDLYCSHAAAPQQASSMEPLPIGIDTGWTPKCATNPPHCDKSIQVRAHIDLEPIGTGKALYTVDMAKKGKEPTVAARWPEVGMLSVFLERGNDKGGTFTVDHTLKPWFELFINSFAYNGELKIDANTLINYLPGADFRPPHHGATNFAPWGWDKSEMQVKGTDLAASKLLSVTFEQLGKLVGTGNFNDYVQGSFDFFATTDSVFTYTTTAVVVENNQKTTISYPAGIVKIPAMDGDYQDITVKTTGNIRYTGKIIFKAGITITKIANIGLGLTFPFDVFDIPYDSGAIPVTFAAAQAHIPLPNVYVPETELKFGKVATGAKVDKKVVIENSGELGAVLKIAPKNNYYKPSVQTATMSAGPDSKLEVTISFTPKKPGKFNSTVTVTSNDPDTPVVEIPVSGEAEGETLPEDPDDAGTSDGGPKGSAYDAPGSDGGCGCRTAPSWSGNTSALALLGLGMAFLIRRRRS